MLERAQDTDWDGLGDLRDWLSDQHDGLGHSKVMPIWLLAG